MKTDTQLLRDVVNELNWDPGFDAAEIGVAVKGEVVTLTGHVSSFAEKLAAEHAVLRIVGIKAVANELEVRLSGLSEPTDSDIAQAAVNALEWNTWVPHDRITIIIRSGWITLGGQVPWHYQRTAAEDTLNHLFGVKGVTNEITVESQLMPADIYEQIERAFRRNLHLTAENVHVEIHDGKVRLFGNVRSWFARQEAERIAWAAPGVIAIENNLTVTPEEGRSSISLPSH